MESWHLPKCKIALPDNIDPLDENFYEVDRLKSLGDKLCFIHNIDYKQGTAYLSFEDPDFGPLMTKLDWVYFQEQD